MEEFLRDEKYYGVFDYDDELTPVFLIMMTN